MFTQLFQQINASGLCNLDIGHTIISFDAAPPLLLYSYIPAIIISLILSFIIFSENRNNLSKAFVVFTGTYSLWVINIILQWVLVSNRLIYTSWQLTAFFEMSFYLSALYFLFSFCLNGPVERKTRNLFLALISLIIILTPSILNISSYDADNCEGKLGTLWPILYAFEILIPIATLAYGIFFSRKVANRNRKKEILLFSFAMTIFLGIFSASNITGEFLQVYSFNLFGPIGMLIFISFVTYLILKYGAFNVKLFSVQVFVWGLLIIVGSEFFFIKEILNLVLVSLTFVAIIVFGRLLIKSVKREVKQKEELVELNTDLKNILSQRESLMHLINHKVKGAFTRSKYIFSGMVEGTFGPINDDVMLRARQGLESDDAGIKTIDLILNAANMQKGTVRYEMHPTNLKDLILKSISNKKVQIEARDLTITTDIKEYPSYDINADTFWLKEAIGNLIENSIKYTKHGTITVSLEKVDKNFLMTIKDTGVGITEEDKQILFTEGGRGKDSVHVNVDSTGYGLYSVKLITEAHKGRVWGESDGQDKGSTFYLELPAIN